MNMFMYGYKCAARALRSHANLTNQTKSMKAMVLWGPGRLSETQVSMPGFRPDGNQVLVRITYSRVCGTDLKIHSGAIPVSYPLIMGHEMIGVVVEGGASEGFRPGDRIILDPTLYCGRCFQCQMGRTNLCPNARLVGRDVDGGFAEYVVTDTNHIFRLPDSISSQAAPLLQVMTTCVHAQRLVKPARGESVVVLGLGVAGQLHVQLAKAHGASPVIGISRNRFKCDMAMQLGADVVLCGGNDAQKNVYDATEGRGADLVVESTGIMTCLAEAIRLVRPGGRVLLFGITTAKEGTLPFYQLYFKEIAQTSARGATREDFVDSIGLVQEGTVLLEPLVSHTLPLRELGTAIKMLASDTDNRLKIIVNHLQN